MSEACIVRAPRRDEVPRVWEMITSLSRYERLEHELDGSAEQLAAALFAERPPTECRVAERGGKLVGYALFFPVFSSFQCRPAMWLDDLFVEDEERGRGTGRRGVRAREVGLGIHCHSPMTLISTRFLRLPSNSP